MVMIRVREFEFNEVICKDSFNRKAQQYCNNIIATLGRIGVKEDSIDVPLEGVAIKKTKASASWYFEGNNMHFSHSEGRFVDNLYVVWKVIELNVDALISGRKNLNDFIHEFSEGEDVEKQRKEAREALGIDPDSKDMDLVNRNYKILAKEFHPDMPNGDHEKFKKINKAHKILKRELE